MKTLETRELPVSLKLAKQHLRVGDLTADDELIDMKLEMAVGIAEDATGRIIREQVVSFTASPINSTQLKLPDFTSAVSKVLSSSRGVLAIQDYKLLNSNVECLLVGDFQRDETLDIEAVVGYSIDTIPPALRAAILLILGTLYDNESDQIVGRTVSELSLTAEKLLKPWRILPY